MEDSLEKPAENSEPNRTDHLKAYQFKPGQSGNPGGRPKKKLIDIALEEELAALDSDKAKKIAKNWVDQALKDWSAANKIAERTEGKAIQKVEHSGADGGPLHVTVKFE